jgi:hypothetical protein
MIPVSRQHNNTSEEAIQEFLDRGGVIEKIPYGKRSEEGALTANSFYGRRKKQPEPKEDNESTTK